MTTERDPVEPATEAGRRLVADVAQAARDMDLDDREQRLLAQLVRLGVILVERETLEVQE